MRRKVLAAAFWLAALAGGGAARAEDRTLDDAVADYRRGDTASALATLGRLAGAEPEAAYWIGAVYEKGGGVPQNLKTAARWYARAADAGFPAGEFRLGLLFDTGQGVTQDRANALKLYLAAAEHGHLAAMRAIGMAYESGNGVEKNPKAALSWYRRAADRGDNESFNRARRLALAMSSDSGLSPVDAAFAEFQRGNQMRALGTLLDAAEAGDAEAKAWLGYFYENGFAGPKDFAKAAKYYAESAAGGSLKGKTDYATALLFGVGIPHDSDAAHRLLNDAAAGGFAIAQFNLAFLEEQSAHGAPGPGLEAARRWYRSAGLLGYQPAWDELARMEGGGSTQPRPAASPTTSAAAPPVGRVTVVPLAPLPIAPRPAAAAGPMPAAPAAPPTSAPAETAPAAQ
jgi:TPR repeat protein